MSFQHSRTWFLATAKNVSTIRRHMKKLNISHPLFRKGKATKAEKELHEKTYNSVHLLCLEVLQGGATKESLKEVVEAALDNALSVSMEERMQKVAELHGLLKERKNG
jgi:hypothetical protein